MANIEEVIKGLEFCARPGLKGCLYETDECPYINNGCRLQMEADALVLLKDQQEIVKCKDCKHRDPEDKKCDCGHAIQWQLPRLDNWYCADGERKDLTNDN